MSEKDDEVRGMEKVLRVVSDLPEIERHETGLWSFDRAVGFGDLRGITLRSLVELYGPEASGKSTLAYYLAGKVAGERGIWVADLEGTMDKWYVNDVTEHAGHSGIIRVSDYGQTKRGKQSWVPHEQQLSDSIDAILDKDYGAGVADSIGAFVSAVSGAKALGERSVGQEAKTINDASKRVATWLRIADDPKLYIYINHTHPNIGGHGFDTPGGRKKKYLSNVRLWIRRTESDIPAGSGNFVAKITVQKLKYGASGKEALVYFIPGYGVSKEMTNVFDCIEEGLAVRGTSVELQGKKMGRIGTLAEKALEPNNHPKTFRPFAEALDAIP
jgi:recombination protein RecA